MPDAQVSPESACAISEQDPHTFVWTASLGITTRSVSRHCCRVQTTIRQEDFAAYAARPPAGFEVRRFVRVLSLESCSACTLSDDRRLAAAVGPLSPCLRRRIGHLSGRLATSRRHLPAGSPAVGSAVTGDLAAVGLCREPFFTLACGKSPRSNPGCPGVARLKGRRFRPALPASLDFLSFSPERVPQNCHSIEMFRATDREGPRAVALCRASHTLRKCRTVTSFHCPGVADPADVVIRRTS